MRSASVLCPYRYLEYIMVRLCVGRQHVTSSTLDDSLAVGSWFTVSCICNKWRVSRLWRWYFPDLITALRLLLTCETALGQAPFCAERRCMTDLYSNSSSSGPCPASTSQPTASCSSVPAGAAGVSLPPQSTSLHSASWHQISHLSLTSLPVSDCTLWLCLSSLLHAPCMLPSATVPSWQLLCLFGTVCQSQFACHNHCLLDAVDWRPSFLLAVL